MCENALKNCANKVNNQFIDTISNTIDELYIELLNIKIKKLECDLHLKEKSEPLQIMKKEHQKWENEINKINSKIIDSYNELGIALDK